MRTAAQRAGDAAEDLVAARLERAGWEILGRKIRVGRSEVDLVAVDPTGPALVIIEVRWRSRRDYGLAEETVDRRKLGRLRAGAWALLDQGALPTGIVLPRLPLRIDLVVLEPGGRIRHHRHVAPE